jgi:uncharacterized protein YigE (DUF2233 family)
MSKATDALLAAALASVIPVLANAGACATDIFESVPFTYCEIDPLSEDLRLWHMAPDGLVYGTFDRINEVLNKQGRTLGIAMNGGMYHEDRSPVGHYVESGVASVPLMTLPGPGNFGMLPNGVFCFGPEGATIRETIRFSQEGVKCSFATQSGPMLVIDGLLHHRFLPDGKSRYIRNGVGVRDDGIVVFAISDLPVNFHRFARLFRDRLNTPNALYIDGNVSRFYAPQLGRHDLGFPLGPIVGTTVPAD